MVDVGFILAILFFGLIALRVLSRLARGSAKKSAPVNYDFDLADLAKMVERGQLTEDEFRRARDVILSKTESKFEPVKGFPVLGPAQKPKE